MENPNGKRVRALILNGKGQLLLGFTNKNKNYMLPGGKLYPNESVLEGLTREISEETGLTYSQYTTPQYLFDVLDNSVYVAQHKNNSVLDPSKDPDKEFSELEFFDLDSLPKLNLDDYAEEIIFKFLSFSTHILNPISAILSNKNKSSVILNILGEEYATPLDYVLNNAKSQLYISEAHLDANILHLNVLGSIDVKTSISLPLSKEIADDVKKYNLNETDLDLNISCLQSSNAIVSNVIYDNSKDKKLIDDIIEELAALYFLDIDKPEIVLEANMDCLGKTVVRNSPSKLITVIHILKAVCSDKNILRQVLAHEMVHHFLFHKFGVDIEHHGEEFKQIAEKINLKEGANYIAVNANETSF